MEIVVAITGASGVAIGARLLEILHQQAQHDVHLIVSHGAETVIRHELGRAVALPAARRWAPDDLAAPIASSSRAPQAMVVAPCSVKTLAAIGHGYAQDLIGRVADIMLRVDRPLILMPRETPLSLPAIESMRQAKLSGALILPPVVAYYPHPQTVQDITDFFVGKVLDLLGLDHDLYQRWGQFREP
jgi:4-hydroxy-3-polyprenylbenzoate decarboxylase